MNYTIEPVDILDPAIDAELRNLIKLAFETVDPIPERYLYSNTASNASEPSFFLAAIEDGKIIGCNGFIANDFMLNGVNYIAYQSCWTAIHPEHQGKKLFVNIINEAKKILKTRGAGFLYGLGNNKSHPILVKKLEFYETPAMIARIPNIPFFRQLFLTRKKIAGTDICIIDEEQVKNYKMAQYPKDGKVFRYKDSWLWGRFSKKKKFGIMIPYFEIGGIHLAHENDLGTLLQEVFRSTKAWFAQIISCESNTCNVLIKNWQLAKMNGFVVYNLNMPDFKHFNVMIGAIDVF